MTIPFVRRRLVVSLESVPSAPTARRFPALEGASDLELARTPEGMNHALDRARWETMLTLHGFRAH